MNQKEIAEILHSLKPEEARDVLQSYYKESLFNVCRDLLGMKDVNDFTHGDVIKALEAPTKRKVIVLPRGCLKSSICIIGYSLWHVFKNPNIRILIDSAYYTNSKNFIRECRAYLESPLVTAIFGKFKNDTNWSEGSITIKQRTKAYKESTITASGVGASKVSQHYDMVLIDDLNDEKNSNTPELQAKIIDHYRRTISLLEPDGTLIVVGTRYGMNDVLGIIFQNEIMMSDPGLV